MHTPYSQEQSFSSPFVDIYYSNILPNISTMERHVANCPELNF